MSRRKQLKPKLCTSISAETSSIMLTIEQSPNSMATNSIACIDENNNYITHTNESDCDTSSTLVSSISPSNNQQQQQQQQQQNKDHNERTQCRLSSNESNNNNNSNNANKSYDEYIPKKKRIINSLYTLTHLQAQDKKNEQQEEINQIKHNKNNDENQLQLIERVCVNKNDEMIEVKQEAVEDVDFVENEEDVDNDEGDEEDEDNDDDDDDNDRDSTSHDTLDHNNNQINTNDILMHSLSLPNTQISSFNSFATSSLSHHSSSNSSNSRSSGNTLQPQLFTCKICSKGFKHRRSLNRHVKLHTGEKHFKCTYCDTAFARSDHLKAHIRTHNNSKPYKCATCQCGYNTQSALKVHIAHTHTCSSLTFNSSNTFKCTHCIKQFDTKLLLDEHVHREHSSASTNLINRKNEMLIHNYDDVSNDSCIKIEHEIKTLVCKYCARVCLGEINLNRHVMEEHSCLQRPQEQQVTNHTYNQFLQQSQSKFVPYNQTIVKHQQQNQQINYPYPYKQQINKTYCDICNVNCSSIEAFYSHNLTTHMNYYAHAAPVNGTYNSYTSPNKSTTMNSTNTPPTQTLSLPPPALQASPLAPPPLPPPNVALSSNGNEHEFYKDICIKEIQYYCGECNLNFVKQQDHLQHIKQEHCVEVHRCVLCKDLQLFDNLALLRHHFQYVHGSKQAEIYRCRLCNSLYRRINDLIQHIRAIHHKPQSHQHSNGTLSNQQPTYKCPHCTFTFISQAFLDQHIDKSHKRHQQLFKCNHCDFSCDSIQLINEHKLNHIKPAITTIAQSLNQQVTISQPPPPQPPLPQPPLALQLQPILQRSKPMLVPGLIQCMFCSAVLNDSNDFNEHFKRHNATNVSQVCIVCKTIIHNDNEYNFHLKTHCNNMQLKSKQQQQQQQQQPHQQQNAHETQSNTGTNSHIENLLNDKNEIVNCNLCSKQLKRSSNDNEFKFDTITSKLQHLCKQCAASSTLPTLSNNNNNNNNKRTTTLNDSIEFINDYYYCLIIDNTNESLKCDKCNIKFETWPLLKQHNLDTQHSISKIYTCIKCHESFKTEIEIREHVQVHINERQKEMCHLCKCTLYTPLQLQCHLLAKHELYPNANSYDHNNILFKCIHCVQVYNKPEDLYVHLLTHTNPLASSLLFKCTSCEMTFLFKQQLLNHSFIHEKDQIKDECCEITPSTSTMSSTSSNASISSTAANEIASENIEKLILDEHQQQQQLNPFITNRKRVVPLTSVVTSNGTNGAKEFVDTIVQNNHTNDYKCVLCDSIFSTQLLLQEHFVNIHTNDDSFNGNTNGNNENSTAAAVDTANEQEKNQQVSPIRNETTRESSFVNNSESLDENNTNVNVSNTSGGNCMSKTPYTKIDSKNSGFKIVRKYFYSCHRCNLDFNSLKVYQAHLLTHGKSPDTNICCNICGKAFANTRNLNVHLRLHTGFKPFECELCKRKFTRKENLRSHMKCHLGIRPFLCPICSKSFGRKSHVITHLEVHLKSKLHKCNQCSLQFDSLSSFIKHTISQHKSTNTSDESTKANRSSSSSGGSISLNCDDAASASLLSLDEKQKSKILSLKELLDARQEINADNRKDNESDELIDGNNVQHKQKFNDHDIINMCQEYVELD